MLPETASASISVLLVTGVIFGQGMGTVLTAQEATLSVTILIVDERQACRPTGYLNYEDDVAESQRCDPLTVADVDAWIARDALSDKIKIPPQRIAIGRLLPFLGTYIEINPGTILNPARRKSAVFLFEWSKPQEFELSFRRISTNPQIPSSKPWTFTMQGERRWIHHERADSLLPAYGVEWVLATGDESITLRTTGESSGP